MITGDLAASWEVTDAGKEFIFHLRHPVFFHDGTTLTAEDVVHSFRILMDPATPTAYRSDFENVVDFRALDAYTVQVKYSEPFAPALSAWASFQVIPKHLVPYARGITGNPLNRKPVGSGPYQFVHWRPQQEIELKAFDHYFGGRPNIDTYRYRIIPDQQTSFIELKAGNLEQNSVTPIQWTRQTQTAAIRKKFNRYKYLGFSYTYMGFNMRRKPFDEKKVRQAISYAINQQEIVKGVLLGQGMPAHGPYRPDLWYSNPNVKPYPYNPNKAKKLLAEVGYKDHDGDGILDRDGQPFKAEIITNQGNELRKKTAEIIQRRLHEIGIDISIRIVEWSAFLTRFINTRNFDLVILGWGLSPEPDQYTMWHSSQTGPTQFNFVSYKNARVDTILEEGRRTLDRDKRAALYRELQAILAEDAPYVWLYIPYSLQLISKKVHGIKPAPAGISYNFDHWWMTSGQTAMQQ